MVLYAMIAMHVHRLISFCVWVFEKKLTQENCFLFYKKCGLFNSFIFLREQSLKMLQTGVEEFKIFLWKISYPNKKVEKKLLPQNKEESLIMEACNKQMHESSKLPE